MIAALCGCCSRIALGIDGAAPFVNGGASSPLGDGTGIVIGIVDSGVDVLHPALAGKDSLGNSRHLASANFVTSESGNTGNDVHGHGTWVASAALSADATYRGLAPDARFVNARVLNNNNGFADDPQVVNGIGFALGKDIDVLNLSLNYGAANSGGFSALDRVVDWAVYALGVNVAICGGNISTGSGGTTLVRSPGSAFNGVTVARTGGDYARVHTDAAQAYTQDGRMKPDVVAPGTGLTLANDDWEGAAADWDAGLGGCSFATPIVAGLMAQQLEYGVAQGLSRHPLVIKTTLMNSARKDVRDKGGSAWEPALATTSPGHLSISRPLDHHAGAGQVTATGLHDQYAAGEHGPGVVPSVGWDLATIIGASTIDYAFSDELLGGSTLTATLSWLRAMTRLDDGDGIVDAGDTFAPLGALDNLNLQLLRGNTLVAESASSIDNVEHLFWTVPATDLYTLRVTRLAVANSGSDELYGLAWSATFVPEPGSLAGILAMAVIRRRIRRRVGR